MEPFYQDSHVTQYCADFRKNELPDKLVHCVCTSPPYWGLRRYSGAQDLIWGGREDCPHKWVRHIEKPRGGVSTLDNPPLVGANKNTEANNRGQDTISNFCSLCGAWKGQLGLELTPEIYLDHLVEIVREARRVMRDDGVCWLNIGDSMWGGKGQSGQGSPEYQANRQDVSLNKPYDHIGGHGLTRPSDGRHPVIKPLDLCMIPQRLAIRLQEDGWYIRQWVIWSKPNPMPESINGWRWERHKVKVGKSNRTLNPINDDSLPLNDKRQPNSMSSDWLAEWEPCPGCPKCSPNGGYILRKGSWRPTEAHEYIIMLTKTSSYYCDAEAVREKQLPQSIARMTRSHLTDYDPGYPTQGPQNLHYGEKLSQEEAETMAGRNLRSVWEFPTEAFPSELRKFGDHFATFPEKLPEICIKASTPEVGVCPKCGAPWARIIEATGRQVTEAMRIAGCDDKGEYDGQDKADYFIGGSQSPSDTKRRILESMGEINKTLGWKPTCKCNSIKPPIPALVLDPFSGTGTTLWVAKKLGRRAVGFDISEGYCRLVLERNRQQVMI